MIIELQADCPRRPRVVHFGNRKRCVCLWLNWESIYAKLCTFYEFRKPFILIQTLDSSRTNEPIPPGQKEEAGSHPGVFCLLPGCHLLHLARLTFVGCETDSVACVVFCSCSPFVMRCYFHCTAVVRQPFLETCRSVVFCFFSLG